jgi:ABC-type branched-subunit amino acid transport system substrate-binding protein
MRHNAGRPVLVLAVAASLLAAACGDDSGKTAATTPVTTAATATATTATGTATTTGVATSVGGTAGTNKVKVMIAGDSTSTIAFTVPEIIPAAKSVLNAFPNVEVETCDTKGDANAATACERKAVSDGVVAVIVGFGAIGQDQAILTAAGIPTIGETITTAADAFSLANGYAQYVGIGVALANAGCKKIGILLLEGTDALGDSIQQGAKSKGVPIAARASITATAPDLAPAVAKLLGAGSDCIALSVTPPQLIQATTAISQTGKKVQLSAVGSVFFPQVIKAMGPLSEGILTIESSLTPADSDPAIQKIKTDMAAVDSKAPFTSAAIYSWLSAKLLAAGLQAVNGDITKESLLTALNGLTNVDMSGVTPPLSMTELPVAAYKRLFNHSDITYKITGGVPVRAGDFFDVGAILSS